MKSAMIPITNHPGVQINPNLAVILANNMMGWYYERYVNIFMDETHIDYVDNVNYEGVVTKIRVFPYTEIVGNVQTIIKNAIECGHFLHIWADEYYIEYSTRYKRKHFVHPLMIYGYDDVSAKFKAIFFDIRRGQIFIDVTYTQFFESVKNVRAYYCLGGNDDAIKQTITECKFVKEAKGIFHLNVLLRQLKNYLYCTTDYLTSWYTLSRPGLCESSNVIYGIQIYQQLIKFLSLPKEYIPIHYKAIHDFISHKKVILERLKYIENEYDCGEYFRKLINDFEKHCRKLEQIRLLNMKLQAKVGEPIASLCCEKDFLCNLRNTLEESYLLEINLIPQIIKCISSLMYPKNYLSSFKVLSIDCNSSCYNRIDKVFYFDDKKIYANRIDVVSQGGGCKNAIDYIIINDKWIYYLDMEYLNESPIRTINCIPEQLKSIKINANDNELQQRLNIFIISEDVNDSNRRVIQLDNRWRGFHHMKNVGFSNGIQFNIVGSDPFIIRDGLCIDSEVYRYIHIRMKVSADTDRAQIYFTTNNSPGLSENASLFFTLNPHPGEHSYYIDMGQSPMWTGMIYSIRLDPAHFYDNYIWKEKPEAICEVTQFEFIKRCHYELSNMQKNIFC